MLALIRRASFWPPSMVYIFSHHYTYILQITVLHVVFKLLRKSFWRRAGFELTEIVSCNLWSKRSTSKPPWLDTFLQLGVVIMIVSLFPLNPRISYSRRSEQCLLHSKSYFLAWKFCGHARLCGMGKVSAPKVPDHVEQWKSIFSQKDWSSDSDGGQRGLFSSYSHVSFLRWVKNTCLLFV